MIVVRVRSRSAGACPRARAPGSCCRPRSCRPPRSSPARSIPSASAAAAPGEVRTTTPVSVRDERQRELVDQMAEQRHRAVGTRLARHDVARAVGVVHPGEPELLDVAADRRLRRVDPQVGEPIADLALAREPLARDEAQDRLLALRFDRTVGRLTAHASSSASASALRGDVDLLGAAIANGGVQRTVAGPAVEPRTPRARIGAATTSAAASSSPTSNPRSRPRPRTSRERPGRRQARDLVAEQIAHGDARSSRSSSSIVASTASAAAHGTGPPPKVDAWSPAANARSAGPRARRSGSPPPSAFASDDDVGHHAGDARRTSQSPHRPIPAWTSSTANSAPCASQRSRTPRR